MSTLLHELLPPVRAEALRLLFGTTPRELHLRELCRLSKLGLGPWQALAAGTRQTGTGNRPGRVSDP